jgi:hypothetical protein
VKVLTLLVHQAKAELVDGCERGLVHIDAVHFDFVELECLEAVEDTD